MLDQTVRGLDRFFQVFLVALMAAMVVSVTWQILSRYLLASPSSWTEEAARFLLIWIGILGASYAFRMKMHIGLDLLHQSLQDRGKAVLDLFISVTAVFFATTVMVIGGARLVMLTWELRQLSAALGIPIAWVYIVIPISGVMILLYAVVDGVDALARLRIARGTH